MKVRRLFVSVALGLGIVLTLLGLLSGRQSLVTAAPSAGTRYVATTGDDAGNDCTSQNTPCRTIQHAVDEADHGDTIKVSTGVYTDVHARSPSDVTASDVVTQVVYISKTIAISGGYSATDWTTPGPDIHLTTLDARGQGRAIFIDQGITVSIEGLRITGGDASGLGGLVLGDPDFGGGVFASQSTVTLRRSEIVDNKAIAGGGVFVGVFSPAVVLSNSQIYSNTAEEEGVGGGACLIGVEDLTVSGNRIHHNTGNLKGAGLLASAFHGRIENNVIAHNRLGTTGTGSGVHIEGGTFDLLHNTLLLNTGGEGSGLRVSATPWGDPSTVSLTNTLVSGQAVGFSVSGGNTATINSVLWYNTPVTVSSSPTAVVTVGNELTGDPAFAADGYHLTSGSAAIDQGVQTDVQTDIDGDPRDANPDLGADEYVRRVYLPLAANNYDASTEVFKLGVLGPFSGRSSRTGEEFKGAVEMALQAIDWRIGDYTIEPVWIDSESDRSKAVQNYEDAIVQEGVEAGLLNWYSSVAVGCMDVVAEHQVPHFAGFGATEYVNETFHSDPNKYGYWTTKWWPTPAKLSALYVDMLEHAIDSGAWSPAARTVVISGEDTDWGRNFGDAIKGHFQDAGWTVLGEVYFTRGQTDFSSALAALTSLNPAVVAGSTTSSESMFALLNQADDAGLESVIIADGLGWMGNWYDETGDSSNYVVDQAGPRWVTAEAQAFADAFEAEYGISPSPTAGGLAYDAANFFIDAAQATYQESGELSSEALYEFVQQDIWTGEWSYTDGIMMEEYKYTGDTIPDPVVGEGYYVFPVVQYFDGESKIVFPQSWADQPFTPPGS
jgi:branched-chain amino acid transport system substrate-binding protein